MLRKFAVNVVSLLDKLRHGYKCVLTSHDLAACFSFVMLMHDYSAEDTVANFLIIISVMGLPASILSDQVQNYVSRTMDKLSTSNEMKYRHLTLIQSKHPSACHY